MAADFGGAASPSHHQDGDSLEAGAWRPSFEAGSAPRTAARPVGMACDGGAGARDQLMTPRISDELRQALIARRTQVEFPNRSACPTVEVCGASDGATAVATAGGVCAAAKRLPESLSAAAEGVCAAAKRLPECFCINGIDDFEQEELWFHESPTVVQASGVSVSMPDAFNVRSFGSA